MRKLFLITVLFLSVVTFAQAQRGTGQRPSQASGGQRPQMNPEQMIQRQVDHLNETLTLTDVQKLKLKEIIQKNGEKQRELFQSMRNSGTQPSEAEREQMKTKRDELRKKETAEIKAILTKDQLPKYDAYLKDLENKMKERRKSDTGGGNR